jgi:hypothetical protein
MKKMKRIITVFMACVLMMGCTSSRSSDADLIQTARNHVETNQKELTAPLSLGKYNPKYTKVEQVGSNYRVNLGYGSLSYDSLWLFTIELSPAGKMLKVEKAFQGYE